MHVRLKIIKLWRAFFRVGQQNLYRTTYFVRKNYKTKISKIALDLDQRYFTRFKYIFLVLKECCEASSVISKYFVRGDVHCHVEH